MSDTHYVSAGWGFSGDPLFVPARAGESRESRERDCFVFAGVLAGFLLRITQVGSAPVSNWQPLISPEVPFPKRPRPPHFLLTSKNLSLSAHRRTHRAPAKSACLDGAAGAFLLVAPRCNALSLTESYFFFSGVQPVLVPVARKKERKQTNPDKGWGRRTGSPPARV